MESILWITMYEFLNLNSGEIDSENFFFYFSYAATQNTLNDDYYNCQPNKYGHSFYTIQWGNQFCLILLQSGWFTLRKFQCQTISLNKSRSLIKFDVQMYGNVWECYFNVKLATISLALHFRFYFLSFKLVIFGTGVFQTTSNLR